MVEGRVPKQLVSTAETLVANAHQSYANAVQHVELGPQIRQGVRDRFLPPDNATSIAQATVHAEVATRVMTLQWQQSRIVYRVSSALLDALLATDRSTVIPGEIFARLPHPDPLVLYDPPRMLDSHSDALLGFLIGSETPAGGLHSHRHKPARRVAHAPLSQ